jgi:plasmid stabilization system protein ParE
LIFYIINEKELCVDIHRILYSRRNWMSILWIND